MTQLNNTLKRRLLHRSGRLAFVQSLLVEAGDTLVALRERHELVLADDIMDVREGLISGAKKDLAQNSVGRILAIGQHYIACRRQPAALIVLQRRDWIGTTAQQFGERAAIEDGLRAAIRAARQHGMRGITEKRYAAKAPSRQRVLIDHRIFQNRFGAPDESRHVEPIEMPVRDCVNEIVEVPGAIPVALLLVMRGFDVDDPIHQLATLLVDIVADGINQNFRGIDPAYAHHARAGEKGIPAGYAAPHVDTRIARRTLIRIKLFTNH